MSRLQGSVRLASSLTLPRVRSVAIARPLVAPFRSFHSQQRPQDGYGRWSKWATAAVGAVAAAAAVGGASVFAKEDAESKGAAVPTDPRAAHSKPPSVGQNPSAPHSVSSHGPSDYDVRVRATATAHVDRRSMKFDGSAIPAWLADIRADPSLSHYVPSQLFPARGDHYILDALNGEGKVEAYEAYLDREGQRMYSVFRIGAAMCGHKGLVHGGALASVIDDSFGWLFMSAFGNGFTANLTVDYRKPVPAGGTYVFKSTVESVDGRKCWLKGTLEDGHGTVHVEARALFIKPRDAGVPIYMVQQGRDSDKSRERSNQKE